MLKLDLQFFGGRGASSGGGGGGVTGIKESDILETTSLVSQRETQRELVDDTLAVFQDFYDEYGTQLEDIELATLKPGASALAYYSHDGVIAVNQSYFDNAKMGTAYADCVASGFHPSNGNKTALQAVVAHEIGHKLTADVATKLGHSDLHSAARTIVAEATKRSGSKKSLASSISGYAKKNHAETIAEAVSDVYCNGSKASKASRAIVDVVNRYLKP